MPVELESPAGADLTMRTTVWVPRSSKVNRSGMLPAQITRFASSLCESFHIPRGRRQGWDSPIRTSASLPRIQHRLPDGLNGCGDEDSTMTQSAMMHSWMSGDDDAIAAAAGCVELRGVPREGLGQFGGEALERVWRREGESGIEENVSKRVPSSLARPRIRATLRTSIPPCQSGVPRKSDPGHGTALRGRAAPMKDGSMTRRRLSRQGSARRSPAAAVPRRGGPARPSRARAGDSSAAAGRAPSRPRSPSPTPGSAGGRAGAAGSATARREAARRGPAGRHWRGPVGSNGRIGKLICQIRHGGRLEEKRRSADAWEYRCRRQRGRQGHDESAERFTKGCSDSKPSSSSKTR